MILKNLARKINFLLFLLTFSIQAFSQSLKPQTDVFFTHTENCYELELVGVEPQNVQIELGEFPFGVQFSSSQKEGFVSKNGERGTKIALWFTFSESGIVNFSPLLVKINGKANYFEFEKVEVHENPALISPLLEIQFISQNLKSQKDGTKILEVKKNEKIEFLVKSRYAVEILDFKWNLPKDSIFSESERFEESRQKATQFTNAAKNISKFEWHILKEGTYSLPEFSATILSFNGSQKQISLPQNIFIIVAGEKSQNNKNPNQKNIFSQAFENPTVQDLKSEENFSRSDFENLAKKQKRSILERLSGKKYALFTGGEIWSVPEENANSQKIAGGQKVKITEQAGDWAFLEHTDFSGWAKSKNLIEIK